MNIKSKKMMMNRFNLSKCAHAVVFCLMVSLAGSLLTACGNPENPDFPGKEELEKAEVEYRSMTTDPEGSISLDGSFLVVPDGGSVTVTVTLALTGEADDLAVKVLKGSQVPDRVTVIVGKLDDPDERLVQVSFLVTGIETKDILDFILEVKVDGVPLPYIELPVIQAVAPGVLVAFSVSDGTGTFEGTVGSTAVEVTAPYGTDISSLTAKVTHSGVSVQLGAGTPDSSTPPVNFPKFDFSSPVTLRVYAADKSFRDYKVTVTVAQPGPGDVAYVKSTNSFYTNLQGAVDASAGTSAAKDTIILLANVSIASDGDLITIPDGKHVELITDGARTISRGADGLGSLITVWGGSLELAGALTLDGKKDTYTAEAALITVSPAGTLTMSGNGVTLKDNDNSYGSGGGVFVKDGGFTMSGGSIAGNTAALDGNSLYNNNGTAKYGGTWGTNNILFGANLYTNVDLPYGSGGVKDPAPAN